MADGELLRLVEGIHRDKNIDREVLFESIESALLSAVRKTLGVSEDLRVTVDRETGEISAFDGDQAIDPARLGRIAAQTAKQVILQKIREAESDVVFADYEQRKGTLVSGRVARLEGGLVIVTLGHVEGILPYGEQMPTENYRSGDRLRALVLEVRRTGSRVKIILSRSHPQFVRELFRLEVPEVNDGTVEIVALVREAGYRTKVAVSSNDPKVDSTGACVGVRGSRIRSIVDELSGEKIDVIRWSESADVLMRSCLRPAEVDRLVLDGGLSLALAVVPQEQLSLAIGRRGQNVRLASRLTGWDIEIVTPEEAERTESAVFVEFESIEGVDERAAGALLGAGCLSARSVMALSDEDLRLILELEPDKTEAMRQWIEANLPEGADHLPAYQQVLAQAEAEAEALAAEAEAEAEARAAEAKAEAEARAAEAEARAAAAEEQAEGAAGDQETSPEVVESAPAAEVGVTEDASSATEPMVEGEAEAAPAEVAPSDGEASVAEESEPVSAAGVEASEGELPGQEPPTDERADDPQTDDTGDRRAPAGQ